MQRLQLAEKDSKKVMLTILHIFYILLETWKTFFKRLHIEFLEVRTTMKKYT